MTSSQLILLQIMAAAFGLVGTLLLATKGRWAGWGFVAYLASNVCWGLFAQQTELWPLLVQHTGFMLASVFGIWVWLVKPKTGNH